MSADNMIYVQKRGDVWWVWMGFASDDNTPMPCRKDDSFSERDAARDFAFRWLRKEAMIEYGVIELDDTESTELWVNRWDDDIKPGYLVEDTK